MDRKRILIIEDDEEIIELIEINVEHLDYETDTAVDGETGLQKAENGQYDLIILDLMLPKLDGMEICKRLRSEKDNTPILMLTAKSEEFDKVMGLELGADDYLTKPFSIRELLARIKANLRRVEVDKQEKFREMKREDLSIGQLVVEPDKRKVTISGKSVSLTPKEFELLHLFAANPGKAFSREELLEQIWGYKFEGYDHTVNSHINRLRNKIEEDPSDPIYLKTVWGIGYRFAEQEEIEE
ncbi:response regulator transcription factor [Fodinibius sediminis]|uniref:Phosphate regulon transcriptional regulatory protein PhoB n=1 Tax=Fodinibius sediminis TaxID=1214077 RepID=A0A521E7I0_9BACT|nr:response regulator transcription factor [Fodinibius sediminis]SMO79361.1 DNA-binding response regulator, OmpR family, contains REC and winged-helix (wHTH) domain [Fodinibius sediminis]